MSNIYNRLSKVGLKSKSKFKHQKRGVSSFLGKHRLIKRKPRKTITKVNAQKGLNTLNIKHAKGENGTSVYVIRLMEYVALNLCEVRTIFHIHVCLVYNVSF